MIILGVDWGRVRAGVAVSDELGLLAHPLETLPADSPRRLVEAVARLAETHRADAVVVGLPRNMDGTEGDSAREARRFAENLESQAGRPVVLWDERLTSWEAERTLRESGAGRRKRKESKDVMAACLILQSYLDAKRASA